MQNTGKAIAHDLKTPLSRTQISLLSALDACDNNENPEAFIQKALDENIHLNELFETLLRISRLQTQTADKSSFSHFALAPLCNDIIGFLQPNADINGQQLLLECDDELQVTGDKNMIQQAVINLLNNAIVHSGQNSTITVKAKKTEADLLIQVCDTGTGIDESAYAKVLEPFYRLDSSRSTEGNGLGLALVQAIVEYHQGSIQLHCNTPHGLCVSLRLPL